MYNSATRLESIQNCYIIFVVRRAKNHDENTQIIKEIT